MPASTSPRQNVLIVGGGIFGLSTAQWMLKDGAYQVTLVDKSHTIPAPDAASTGECSIDIPC